MERITGINDLRPRLTKYVEMVRDGSPVVVTVNSQPQAVLVGYEEYRELLRAREDNKTLALRLSIADVRSKARAAGISADDVQREIEAHRKQDEGRS